MRHNLSLNLIYHYTSIKVEDNVKSYYVLNSFFSDAGFVASETLSKFYQLDYHVYHEGKLCFETLEDLGQFALKVCVELKAPEVFVLSSMDFNTGVESARDLRNFKEIFRRFGNSLSNPELDQDKENIFSRLLKK